MLCFKNLYEMTAIARLNIRRRRRRMKKKKKKKKQRRRRTFY
jgi:hypothetical protein